MLNLEAVASNMEDLAESLKSITISHNSLVGAVDDIKEDVKETVKTIQGELHELEGKVNLLIRATSNPIKGSYEVGNTKIPEPKAFGGAHDAKEQTGSIREYVREFSTLMLNIKDMIGTDRLFNFLKGLKPWARNKLMRQNIKELKTTLVIVESLDDYSTNTSKRKFDSPPSLDNRPKWGKTSSGGVNKDYSPFEGIKSKSWGFKTRADRPTNLGKEPNNGGSWNDQSPRINNMTMTEPKQSKCYLCDGPHRFTDCPHKGALNVLRAI
ncbi:hypothetical protein GH714_022430 [Hevea brasiliensis]|uniref:Retrotransposon gag domain-containing protein n=1 Tax=Hevea brasiliensis TaxID=3981 RepID=A0A6A6LZQ8_HEVBR|nr:hypothetical protein GH714_022430 [Hevea brasiliensis]